MCVYIYLIPFCVWLVCGFFCLLVVVFFLFVFCLVLWVSFGYFCWFVFLLRSPLKSAVVRGQAVYEYIVYKASCQGMGVAYLL